MKKIQKEHSKFSFDADALWNRLSNKKTAGGGGKDIQKMLGIEDEGPEPLGGKRLRLMDLVKDMYEQGESYEEED